MHVVWLAPLSSAHTLHWTTRLAALGSRVSIISLPQHWQSSHITSSELEERHGIRAFKLSASLPLPYVSHLRRLLDELKPDLLHAHYASSYGLLGAMSRYHPYILSMWGSDVVEFPTRSPIHRTILTHNFRAADQLLATSASLAREAAKYTSKPITLTPFGVDTDVFRPQPPIAKKTITIGTTKGLKHVYGVDYLIRYFKQVRDQSPGLSLNLKIAGGGPKEAEYRALVDQLGLSSYTSFTGQVPHHAIKTLLSEIDIYVALSREESFGLAILEASACGKPVVVSNAGGLPEVTSDKRTGYVVPNGDINAAAQAMLKLIQDPDLRQTMGAAGRTMVEEKFSAKVCTQRVLDIYQATVSV